MAALVAVVLSAHAGGRSTGAPSTPHRDGKSATAPSAPKNASERILFARGTDERDGGDLWIIDADGRQERRLTTRGGFSDLSSDGRRVACFAHQNLYSLAPAVWQQKRVRIPPLPSVPVEAGLPRDLPPYQTWLSGGTAWRPGRRQLFVGTGLGDAGDGGLWRVDIGRQTLRRVLPRLDADFPLNDQILVSPRGTRVAAGGYGDMYGWLRVADLRTGRQIRQPARRGILGMTDFAWLDEDNLLLPGAPGSDWEEKGHWETSKGGIRRLNLRTRRLTRWLYSADADVVQICRSPKGDHFAIGLDGVDTAAILPGMAARVELVDRRTKARHPLRLPGPAHLCGFSRDGRRLLVLVLARTEPATRDNQYRGMKSDAWVVDVGSGGCRRVAREAFDAVWVEGR